MIVLDANLLLYAYDSTSPQYKVAKAWLAGALAGPEIIALPWQCVWAFLRLSTNGRIFTTPLSMEQAVGVVDSWIALEHVHVLAPRSGHWKLLKEMLLKGQVRGSHATDAELAALTVEHGGVLYTTDRDFARFPGLRWVNPLQP